MKKIVLTAIGAFFALAASAQDDALRAIECKGFQSAVEKNLKNTENPKKSTKSATWLDLGNSYLDLAERCPEDSTAAAKAEDAYKKALEVENAAGGKKAKEIQDILKSQRLSTGYLQQGAAFYNNKNYKMAAEYFSKSSDIATTDTTAALYAGIAQQMLENYDGAAQYLSKFVDNGGKDPSVIYSLAQIYRTQKNYDGAVAILKKGMALDPANTDFPNELVNVYLASGNIDKAIVDLEEIAKNDPKNVTSITNLGLIYDTKAQEYSTEIGKINSKIADASTEKLDKKLVLEQDKLSAYQEEIKNLNARLKKDPKTAATTKKRIAEVQAQATDIEKDIAAIMEDINKKKSSAGDINQLNSQIASLKSEQDKYRVKAVENYNKVLALDPNNFDVLYNLAVMYYNEAVEIKRPVDHMDIATYRKEGKAIEDKACAKFAEAKPYFERAASIKDDEVVKDTLGNLKNILEQCSK